MANPVGYYHGRTRPADDWIIPGWLTRGNNGFIIGPPKKGKSWLLLNLLWDLSEGRNIWAVVRNHAGITEELFVPTRPMTAVYFAQEDTDDNLQERVELLINKGGRKPNNRLWLVPKNLAYMLDSDEGRKEIETELDATVAKAGAIDLVAFDPMRRMHYKSENDSENMAALWRVLDIIHKRYRCATLFTHHVTKPPTVKGNTFDLSDPFAARGSGDIYGGGDAFINIVPLKKAGNPSLTTKSIPLAIHFQTKRARPLAAIDVTIDLDSGLVGFDGFHT